MAPHLQSTTKKRSRSSQKGISLAEALIALIVLAAGAAGATRLISDQSKSLVRMRAIQDLDAISRKLKEMVDKPYLFQKTIMAPPNAVFKNCIDAGAACSQTSLAGLTVMNPYGTATSILAGPPSSPMFYNLGGTPCTGAGCSTTDFPIEAIAGFTGTGAGVRFYFCLRKRVQQQISGLEFTGGVPASAYTDPNYFPSCKIFYANQNAIVAKEPLRPTRLAYDPQAALITFNRFAPCPPNQFMNGLNPDGSPICSTVTQANNANTANTANNANIANFASTINGGQCPPGYVVRAINTNGTPDCRSAVQALEYQRVDGVTGGGTGVGCGWASISGYTGLPMQHVVGSVCCPAGKIAIGGGGQCNTPPNGGILEQSYPASATCWALDCCKFSPFSPATIFVNCIRNN